MNRKVHLLVVLVAILFSPSGLESQSCSTCEQPPLWECVEWDSVNCQCLYVNPGSPILIDLSGSGLRLTSAADGVRFDLRGDGRRIQIGWTRVDALSAFLFLDRNGNGVVDNGRELFGNFTQQPPSDNPNGFIALAEFDKPQNGGNGDGFITSQDSIYSSLRLWIDANHNGVSERGELSKLNEHGIESLSFSPLEAERRDQYGNRFRYRARVGFTAERPEIPHDAWAYDVFFVGSKTLTVRRLMTIHNTALQESTSTEIPDDVATEIFFSLAACPAGASSLQQQKCAFARKPLGLSSADSKVLEDELRIHAVGMQVLKTEMALAMSNHTRDGGAVREDLRARKSLLVQQRNSALRNRLTPEGKSLLDSHVRYLKSKIKFVSVARAR